MLRVKSQSDFHLQGKNRYLVINQPKKVKPKYEFGYNQRRRQPLNSRLNKSVDNVSSSVGLKHSSPESHRSMLLAAADHAEINGEPSSSKRVVKINDESFESRHGDGSSGGGSGALLNQSFTLDKIIQVPEESSYENNSQRMDKSKRTSSRLNRPSPAEKKSISFGHHPKLPPIQRQHSNPSLFAQQPRQQKYQRGSMRVIDSNRTSHFLNGLFDDAAGDVDEWESSQFDTSLSQTGDPSDTNNSSSPMMASSRRMTTTTITSKTARTKEITNLAVSLDGYEGIKVAFFDRHNDLFESSRYIFFDLEKKIQTAATAATTDSHRRLVKVLLLKYLLRLSVKLIGKYFIDLSVEEKKRLEVECNRFFSHSGDESSTTATLRVVGDRNGRVGIRINEKYETRASDFIQLYLRRLLESGLKSANYVISNVYVIIPQAFGSMQRKAIKSCLSSFCPNACCFLLTRPLIGAASMDISSNAPTSSTRLVFDMTLDTLDVTLVKAVRKSSASFLSYQVLNNIGDISLGLEDIDERLANHILTQRLARLDNDHHSTAAASEAPTNESNHDISILSVMMLVGAIKSALSVRDAAIDIKDANESENMAIRMSRELVANELCRDIYDWSLVHIKRCLREAQLEGIERVDSVIFMFDEIKMPGFVEYFRKVSFQSKQTTTTSNIELKFLSEHDIAISGLKLGIKTRVKKLKCQDVVSRSIGIGLYNGAVNFLVRRNTQLPFSTELELSPSSSSSSSSSSADVTATVAEFYEGERPHVKYCKYIGKLVFTRPHVRYANIKLVLSIDAEGVMSLKSSSERDSDTFVWIEDVKRRAFVGSKNGFDEGEEEDDEDEDDDDEEADERYGEKRKATSCRARLNPENLELDPIEADRFRHEDLALNKSLEDLDAFMLSLRLKHSQHTSSNRSSNRSHNSAAAVRARISEVKTWIERNRLTLSVEICRLIKLELQEFAHRFDDHDDESSPR